MAYNMGGRSDEELERLRQQALQQQSTQQYSGYKPGATVNNYQQQANVIQGQKPVDYNSKYQAGIDQLFDKILNRGKFEYDMNADTLYKQAMDKFSAQAKMGMQDTMGQAQSMTGGYGNSYAQTAGQQMYDKTMQNVTDMLPAMEERAHARWRGEGDDMARDLSISQSMEQDEYGRYRDAKGDWQFDYGQALDRYNQERGFDYGAHVDDRNYQEQKSQFDQNISMQKDQFDRNMMVQKDQFDRNMSAQKDQFEQELALRVRSQELNEKQAEEQRRQFDASQAQQAEQFNASQAQQADQWQQNFNASEAAAAQQASQWQQTFDANQAPAKSSSKRSKTPEFSDEEIALYEQMLAEEEAKKKKVPLKQLYDPFKGTSGGYTR